MDVCVVGAGGLLGSNVVRAGRERGWTVTGTYHSGGIEQSIPATQFDLADASDSFGAVLDEFAPDAVVNCAAMTDVDGCEDAPEHARAINGDAPGELAEQCAERDVAFCHVSTDYVFSGQEDGRYAEDDATDPVQVYGESKLAGERAVRSANEAALIVRPSFVWGVHRGTDDLTGFPAWVRGELAAGNSIPLFTDQHVTPTRAGSGARVLLDLLAASASGTFHVASRSCVTPRAFGDAIADVGGYDASLIEDGSMADVDRAARRPAHTCLDVERVEGVLGESMPTVRADLEAVRESL